MQFVRDPCWLYVSVCIGEGKKKTLNTFHYKCLLKYVEYRILYTFIIKFKNTEYSKYTKTVCKVSPN